MVMSIYYIVVNMVKKAEIIQYYAERRKDGECPNFILKYLEGVDEDDFGMYTLAGELIGKRDYYLFDEVIRSIRAEINQLIRDLQKISEI